MFVLSVDESTRVSPAFFRVMEHALWFRRGCEWIDVREDELSPVPSQCLSPVALAKGDWWTMTVLSFKKDEARYVRQTSWVRRQGFRASL